MSEEVYQIRNGRIDSLSNPAVHNRDNGGLEFEEANPGPDYPETDLKSETQAQDSPESAEEKVSQLPAIEPVPVKPAYKTTELYLTALIVVGAMVNLFDLNLDASRIESVATIIAILAPTAAIVWRYLSARQNIKTQAIMSTADVQIAKINNGR